MARNTLFVLFFCCAIHVQAQHYAVDKALQEEHGAYYRGDTSQKVIYLNFTAHEFYEGLPYVRKVLDSFDIKASFFLTGDFVRKEPGWVKQLYKDGHYIGAHSNKHLLYCDWTKRDSLLETIPTIKEDLRDNVKALKKLKIPLEKMNFFMPPYEWYNKEIYDLVKKMGLIMVNFTPGTSSNADYTTPGMKNYTSSDTIIQRIKRYERFNPAGMNGFHLLIHVGTEPARTDKLYTRLPELISYLISKGYRFERFK